MQRVYNIKCHVLIKYDGELKCLHLCWLGICKPKIDNYDIKLKYDTLTLLTMSFFFYWKKNENLYFYVELKNPLCYNKSYWNWFENFYFRVNQSILALLIYYL